MFKLDSRRCDTAYFKPWWPTRCILLIALCGYGCGKVEPPPQTVPVGGLVTFKGQPLAKGTVTLQPLDAGEDGALLRPAIGEIDSTGHYQIGTFSTGDGALPGNYQVVVTSFENDPTAEEYDQGVQRVSAIPERYSNAITSELLLEVPAASTEPITFDITLVE